MLPDNKTKTNIGVGLGFLLEILGRFLYMSSTAVSIFGLILMLVGVVLFIWGCMNYAVGKGHSKWLGLLGLLSCIGLIILVFLPDHHKEG
jgi:uncharacterized membrane protein